MIRRSFLIVAATIAVIAAPILFVPFVPTLDLVNTIRLSPDNLMPVTILPVIAIICAWSIVIGVVAALINGVAPRSVRQRLIMGGSGKPDWPMYRDRDGVFRRSAF